MLDGFPLGLESDPHWGQPMVPIVGDINKDGFVDIVCPSNNGKLSFVNFPGVLHRPRLSFCPMWQYNRRLNGIPPMLFSPNSECVGLTGNVDCDQEDMVDLGDLTTMIDYLFITMTPLCSPGEANTDGDAEGIIDLGDLTALIDFLFISFTPPAACL